MEKPKVLIIGDIRSVHTRRWGEALARDGYRVTVLTVRPGELAAVEVIDRDPGDGERLKLLKYLKQFGFLLTEAWLLVVRRFDIVHVHFLRMDLTAPVATLHPRSVISVWGSDMRLEEEGGYTRWVGFQRYALRHARLITATNPFLAKRARLRAERDIPVEVVPFGVDFDTFKPMDGARNDSTIRFCFCKGSLIETYAPDLLIHAFATVAREIAEVHLTLTGDVVDKFGEGLSELVGHYGLEDRVTFTRRLEHHRMAELLRTCDVCVQSSRWESFGVILLEAMACGIAVIATDVGGVREIVDNEVTGLVVPAGDVEALAAAMLRLAKETELRTRLARQGYEFVQNNYDFRHNVRRMETLYDNLLQRK